MAFVPTLEIKNKTSGFTHRRAVFAYIDKFGKEQYVEGLDIKFEVRSAGDSILPSARIDVCNLNTDVVKYLTTITPFNNQHRVALYVGYEDNLNGKKTTVLPKLYEGRIRNATFTYIPDMWLEMYCLSDSVEMYNPVFTYIDTVDFSLNVKSVRDFLNWLNKKLQEQNKTYSILIDKEAFKDKIYYNLLFDSKTSLKFNINGKNVIEVLNEIVKTYNLTIWENIDGSFVIRPNTNLIKSDKEPTIKWNVNLKTGMIGFPTVSVSVAEVTVLMNPRILGGDGVLLESKLYNNIYIEGKEGSSNAIASNGKYTVVSVTHRGHLRGNEWYSKLYMTRGGW